MRKTLSRYYSGLLLGHSALCIFLAVSALCFHIRVPYAPPRRMIERSSFFVLCLFVVLQRQGATLLRSCALCLVEQAHQPPTTRAVLSAHVPLHHLANYVATFGTTHKMGLSRYDSGLLLGLRPPLFFIRYRLYASHSSPLRTARKDDRKVILLLFFVLPILVYLRKSLGR